MNINDVKVGMRVRRTHSSIPLTKGGVYIVEALSAGGSLILRGFPNGKYDPECFESAETIEIPEVPFKDLTDDQKIELVSIGIRTGTLEFKPHDCAVWKEKQVIDAWGSLNSFNQNTIYRVKPSKTPRELEIERIEAEMRTLADDLSKLKGE